MKTIQHKFPSLKNSRTYKAKSWTTRLCFGKIIHFVGCSFRLAAFSQKNVNYEHFYNNLTTSKSYNIGAIMFYSGYFLLSLRSSHKTTAEIITCARHCDSRPQPAKPLSIVWNTLKSVGILQRLRSKRGAEKLAKKVLFNRINSPCVR